MSQSAPWISFHAPWVDRSRSGMVPLARVQRFLAACAVDPAPDSGELRVHEELGADFARRTRELESTQENIEKALESVGYRPGPLVAEVAEAMGTAGTHGTWASGSSGFLLRWQWERKRPFDPAPMIALYQRHEKDPPVASSPSKRGLDVTLSYWFEVKRPGSTEPLFPGAELRSSVMIWLGSRRTNLSLRYQSSEMTPALREAHTEIVAALGPKTPPHALQRIISLPGGRERREPIS